MTKKSFKHVTEAEYLRLKDLLMEDKLTIRQLSLATGRAFSTLMNIKKSSNFAEYHTLMARGVKKAETPGLDDIITDMRVLRDNLDRFLSIRSN